MFRKSNLAALVALAVGAVGGWAGASGKLDTLLRAEQTATPAAQSTPCLEGSCANPNKAIVLNALDAHNQQVAAKLQKDGKKPNILVIWGDDIGIWNISHNNRGMMGYMTPNIDRIAREGVSFTDYYGQQSCTAGRAAFIGGNVPVRTGMTKVGLPGAKEGWQKTDVTIATVLLSRRLWSTSSRCGRGEPPTSLNSERRITLSSAPDSFPKARTSRITGRRLEMRSSRRS